MYKKLFMQTITKQLVRKSGIYCILNLQNQKKYIGSSNNLYERLKNHDNQLNSNTHFNKILQNSWNKYKKENFIFIILEYCNKNKLIEKEQFYIDNIKPEFNIVKNITENIITGKEIYQYDLNGNFIKKYDYIKLACLENNISQSTICRFLNGTYKKGGNYLWSLTFKEKLEPYVKIRKDKGLLNKKVNLIDCNNLEIIKTFNSLKECANYLQIFPSEISKGIKNNRKFKNKYFIKKAALNSDI